MIEFDGNAVLLRRGLDDAQAFRHHFLADAVAGDDRDPVLFLVLIENVPCDLPGGAVYDWTLQ